MKKALATLCALLFLAPAAALGAPTPYEQGKVRVGLNGGGFGSRSGIDFYIQATFGVFVVDNLEVGADLAFWFGEDQPTISQLGPTVRYIFPVTDVVHPYLGAFYYHWFIGDDIDDRDTIGARAGILVRSSSVFVTVGLAVEQTVSTCDSRFEDCFDIYPEFGVAFVF